MMPYKNILLAAIMAGITLLSSCAPAGRIESSSPPIPRQVHPTPLPVPVGRLEVRTISGPDGDYCTDLLAGMLVDLGFTVIVQDRIMIRQENGNAVLYPKTLSSIPLAGTGSIPLGVLTGTIKGGETPSPGYADIKINLRLQDGEKGGILWSDQAEFWSKEVCRRGDVKRAVGRLSASFSKNFQPLPRTDRDSKKATIPLPQSPE